MELVSLLEASDAVRRELTETGSHVCGGQHCLQHRPKLLCFVESDARRCRHTMGVRARDAWLVAHNQWPIGLLLHRTDRLLASLLCDQRGKGYTGMEKLTVSSKTRHTAYKDYIA